MSTVSLICKYYPELQRLVSRQHVWVSLTRVVDRATIGISVTAEAAVPSPTAAPADLTEPLHRPLLGGGRVYQAVLWLAVLALLPQRFLFLEENCFVWTFGHLDIWTVN